MWVGSLQNSEIFPDHKVSSHGVNGSCVKQVCQVKAKGIMLKVSCYEYEEFTIFILWFLALCIIAYDCFQEDTVIIVSLEDKYITLCCHFIQIVEKW